MRMDVEAEVIWLRLMAQVRPEDEAIDRMRGAACTVRALLAIKR